MKHHETSRDNWTEYIGKLVGFGFAASLIAVPMAVSMWIAGIGASRLLGHSLEMAGGALVLVLIGGAAIDLLKGLCAFAAFESLRARNWTALSWTAGFVVLLALSLLCEHASVKNLLQEAQRQGTHASRADAALEADLKALDDEISAIKAKGVPRPSDTVSWAIKTTTVPILARKNSEDCLRPEDAATSKVCQPLRDLRSELASAEDLERLQARASALRKEQAGAQIVADRDPLATSFDELVAPLLRRVTGNDVRGETGVPFLAMIALEVFSCMGVTLIANRYRATFATRTVTVGMRIPAEQGVPTTRVQQAGPGTPPQTVPSKVVKRVPKARRSRLGDTLAPNAAKLQKTAGEGGRVLPFPGDHPPAPDGAPGGLRQFIVERCRRVPDDAVPAATIFYEYLDWCGDRSCEALSQTRFGRELVGMGFTRWKSHGRKYYRGLQVLAREAAA